MSMTIHELSARLRSAMCVLNLLMETDAAGEAVDKQRTHVRELRAMLNRECPDSETYDPRADNIVERI